MKRPVFYFALLTAIIFFSSSCRKGGEVLPPPSIPTVPVLLQEINIPNLPSPYYRFEYDSAGKPGLASFASGIRKYIINYNRNKISEMRSILNKDKLQYHYDTYGRVNIVLFADSTGNVYKRMKLYYSGNQLIKSEREVKSKTRFLVEKAMTFKYYSDGNLKELSHHRYPVHEQEEYTSVDLFEHYDNKINVDGFALLHNEFFEHLVLLPDVQLQKNNPGKVTRTGTGVNYKIHYAFTYNDKRLPLVKSGDAIFTSGPEAGKSFQTKSIFSYY